jgi:hypothetical protein
MGSIGLVWEVPLPRELAGIREWRTLSRRGEDAQKSVCGSCFIAKRNEPDVKRQHSKLEVEYRERPCVSS